MKGTIFDLSGRSALVTGGSRGLGKAMARIFAEAGAEVMICGRTDAQLKQTSREIADATGGRVEYEVADMGVRDDVGRLARATERRLGKVDILVNNAGWNILSPIDEIKDEDWDYLLQLNVTSTMALTRALAPGMKDRRWGRIIYISSILALTSTATRNAYSATKSRPDRTGQGQRLRPRALRHHGQLHRAGALCHRDADVDPQQGATRHICEAHGAGPVGKARRVGRRRPALGQRRRQLHHRHDPGRRWRRDREDVLSSGDPTLYEVTTRGPGPKGKLPLRCTAGTRELRIQTHAQSTSPRTNAGGERRNPPVGADLSCA